MPKFSAFQTVWYKGTRPAVILRDLGLLTPKSSSAPLAESWPPEQAYMIEVQFPGFADKRGAWESDLTVRTV